MALTTGGITEVVDLLGNVSSPIEYGWIAYGTGTTAESAAHTTLATETARVAATVSLVSILAPEDTLRFFALATAGSTITLTEIGVFNDADSGEGDMLGRILLDTPVSVTAEDQIILIYDFPIKDGGPVAGSGW